jgi:hypothetical protein
MTKMTNVSAWSKILAVTALVATILLSLSSKKDSTVGLKGSRRLQNPPNFVDLSGQQLEPPSLPDFAPLVGNLVAPPGIINSSVDIPQPGNFVNSNTPQFQTPEFQNNQGSNGPRIPDFAPIPNEAFQIESFPGNNFQDFPTFSTPGNIMNGNDFIRNPIQNTMNEQINRAPNVMFNSQAPVMFSNPISFNDPIIGNLISGINATSSLITSTIGVTGNSNSVNNLINNVNASFTAISGQSFQQFPTSP